MQSAIYNIRANEADQLVRTLQPIGRKALGALVACLAAAALVAFASENTGAAVTVAGVAVALVLLVYWVTRRVRRAIHGWIDRHLLCGAYVQWDQAGLRTGGCLHGEDGSWPWSAIGSVRENSDFLVLKIAACSQIIPKRALSTDADNDLRRHFAANAIPVMKA